MQKNPACIGIILDGNRRWAKERGLPTLEGHRKGLDTLMRCTRWVRDRGIRNLVVYAFSTENWKRSEEEVSYLMRLIIEAAGHEMQELAQERVRMRFLGERGRLPKDVLEAMEKVERESVDNDDLTLWVCLSYGARAEITDAARSLTFSGGDITEENLRAHFWSAGMPDPDIVIRTGGEKRLSNFLLWQAAYAELFFLDFHWPDFSEGALDAILSQYESRERRLGR